MSERLSLAKSEVMDGEVARYGMSKKVHDGDNQNRLVCNVCKSRLIAHYTKVQDLTTGEIFSIHRCIKCGLGHTLPQPEDLAEYYGQSYYGNRHGLTDKYCIKRRTRLVFSETENHEGQRLLDIGCGDGAFLRAMQNAGWDVAGTEINPDLESTEGLVVKKDLDQLSDCVPFHCITMWHTLEHMQDIGSTLGQINDLLEPNGRLIVAVPNNSSFQARVFKEKWLHLDIPRHLYHFDVRSLQHSLRAAGFVIQNQRYQELEYDLFGWTQSALNTIFTAQNVFFDSLRGKSREHGWPITVLNWFMGALFLALSLPAVIIERLFNRSGTIIAIARKGDMHTVPANEEYYTA